MGTLVRVLTPRDEVVEPTVFSNRCDLLEALTLSIMYQVVVPGASGLLSS